MLSAFKDIFFRALMPMWVSLILGAIAFAVTWFLIDPMWAKTVLYGVLIAAMVVMAGYAAYTGAPPMGSSVRDQQTLLSALETYLKTPQDGVIYELGAGFGDLAVALAKQYPDHTIKAYEISPLPWAVLRFRRWLGRYKNLEIHRADFFEADLSDADAVVCYLYPVIMERLAPKLSEELRSGGLVICNAFAMNFGEMSSAKSGQSDFQALASIPTRRRHQNKHLIHVYQR